MNRHLWGALALFWLVACSGGEPAHVIGAGETRLESAADGSELRLFHGSELRLRWPADAFTLGVVDAHEETRAYDPYHLESEHAGLAKPPEGLRWFAPKGSRVERASAAEIVLALDYGRGLSASLSFRAEGDRISARWQASAEEGYAAWYRLRPRADAEEGFYGLGGFPDTVNHRGRLRPMQIELDGTESGYNELHTGIPFLIGTEGWGLFVASRRAGVFGVAHKEADLVEATFASGPQTEALDFHLFTAAHPLDVSRPYYRLTGEYRMPAEWALGPVLWRNDNTGQAQVEEDVDRLRALDLAATAFWIDRPYATALQTFDFDARRYDDPAAMVSKLHAAGLRLGLWHTSYVTKESGEHWETAHEKGYLPPVLGPVVNHFGGVLVDFTNPEAVAWWQGLLKRYTDLGVEGYKLDFAEDIQVSLFDARLVWEFADGRDDRTMYDGYQRLFHQTYAETLPETGGFLLCRTARWGDQTNGVIVWPGDLSSSFTRFKEEYTPRGKDTVHTSNGGLVASLVIGLGLGPVGFPLYGSDTGGYLHSPPDPELFLRWTQVTALSSVMQVGNARSLQPWEILTQEEDLDIYRRFARLHLRLWPYAWTLLSEVSKTGRPLQRPLGLAHPELGQHPDDAFLFGDDLFVAPVLRRGADTRRVWLPEGGWTDWFEGTRYEGGREVEIPAPLEKLPLLARAGALIPLLRPTIDTVAPTTRGDVDSLATQTGLLWVRAVPGEGRFELFDGTRLEQREEGAAQILSYEPGGRFGEGVVFEVQRARPASVEAAGGALPEQTDGAAFEAAAQGWHWSEEAGGLLRIKPGAGAARITLR